MIYLIPAGVFFLMGWLIRYKKQTWLISGYNISSKEKKEKYDLDKLTRLMGSFLFLLGSVFLLMFVASILLTGYENEIAWVGFSVESLVIIAGLIYLNTGNRVKKT
jgi:hypothetical protein